MIKYKIYELTRTTMGEIYDDTPPRNRFFINESDINDPHVGYDTEQEALDRINQAGIPGKNYTVLKDVTL